MSASLRIGHSGLPHHLSVHAHQLRALRSLNVLSISSATAGATLSSRACSVARADAMTQAADSADDAASPPAPRAAYVHLPFCKRKCFYCDFPVEAVGLNVGKARTQDRMAAYVDLVCAEICATSPLRQQLPLETVSFGGGTPSLVPPHHLERILSALQQQFGIAPDAELSLEADPGTFDLQRLHQYRDLGISRLSMGVQSFQQEMLEACGRSHNLQEVYAAIEAVKSVGFPSWSLDLISGLPQLNLDSWQYSLDQAVAAGPDHISVYDLQVEQGTPFERWHSGPNSSLPQETEAVRMFEMASATLTSAGYEHYEISNYAKPGHRSRHNQVYWHCQPYYAFGLGAASYTRGRRFTRPRSMKQYEQWVQEYTQSGTGCPAARIPPESKEDQLLNLIMLRLRLSDGLDLQAVQQHYGQRCVAALLPAIQRFCSQGLMQLVQPRADPHLQGSTGTSRAGAFDDAAWLRLQEQLQQGSMPCSVRLTDPAGFLLSNDVIAELFAQLDPKLLASEEAMAM